MGDRILPLRETSDGWAVLTIPWYSVPDYLFEEASKGLSQAAIEQELLINWNVSSGARVYPEYDPRRHLATERLPFEPHQPLYVGLDFGMCPAAAFAQLNHWGQLLCYETVAPPAEIRLGPYEFGEMIARHLDKKFAGPAGLEIDDLKLIFIGDPAGNRPPAHTGTGPREERTHYDILRRGIDMRVGTDARGKPIVEHKPGWGWRVRPGKVEITARIEAVRARLLLDIDGLAGLVIDPNARFLAECFGGGYHYHQKADGRIELDPYKDHASHLMDALGYLCTRLSVTPDDDDARPQRDEFVSHGARRSRER
jgi:hypothetical protein